MNLAKGAKAELVCPPDYAYGSRAMGPIPANSLLLFSIEVVDIEPAKKPETEDKPKTEEKPKVEEKPKTEEKPKA